MGRAAAERGDGRGKNPPLTDSVFRFNRSFCFASGGVACLLRGRGEGRGRNGTRQGDNYIVAGETGSVKSYIEVKLWI